MPLTRDQREAVTRIGDDLCVVAGAGTGKTRVLVDRYVNLLSKGDLSTDQIAAITFTEKAAAEMLGRVRRACDLLSRRARTAALRRLWLSRRDSLTASSITTIHAFCAQLVRQFPVEAEVDPSFQIADEAVLRPLLDASVHGTVRRLLDADGPDVRRVVRSYRLTTLTKLLARAVTLRARVLDTAGVLDEPSEAVLGRLREAVEAALGSSIDAMLDTLQREAGLVRASAGGAEDRAEIARQETVEALDMLEPGQPLAIRQDGLHALGAISLRGGSARKWPSPELLKEVKEGIGRLRDAARKVVADCDVTDPSAWPAELEVSRSLMRVAMEAVEDFARAKAGQGVLDYEDLLLKTRDLLRHHPRTRAALASRYRQVLVDELQDTDALQAEILNLLLSDTPGETFSPRPGTFFGVGDPKQSIYRFRGADVGVFRHMARSLGAQGVVRLSKTFRFHQGLAGVTNTVFGRVLGEDFSPLEADRSESPPVSAEVLLAAGGDRLLADDTRRREAARVARRIRELVESEEAGFGDIAILMHRQTQSFRYEDALSHLEIPFYVVRGRRFYEQQEVRDVLTALQAIRSPGDSLSVSSLLRGPLFGMSDEGLYQLCRFGAPGEALYSDAARAPLSPADRVKVTRAAAWLAHFAERAGRVGVAELVEEVLFHGPGGPGATDRSSHGGLAHVMLPNFLGDRRYANLRRLVEMARRQEREGSGRLEEFIQSIELSIGRGVREAEAPASEEGKGAVLLMTVHRAKGLEFPFVFLINADAGRQPKAEPFYLSASLGLAPCCPDRPVDARRPAAYTVLRHHDARQEADEFARLFYVGATRAQERLFVTGSQNISPGSWLDILGSGIGVDLRAEPVGRRPVDLADGANVVVDVADTEPLKPGRPRLRGVVASLCRDGDVDEASLARLRARKGAAQVAARLTARIAPVAEDRSRVSVSATALSDYARCPAAFHLRHVLRLQDLPARGAAERRSPDGAAIGDLVHRYLATADFGRPLVDDKAVSQLVTQDPRIPAGRREQAEQRILGLLNNLVATGLPAKLAAAKTVVREVPFLLVRHGVTVEGRLDLLYQDGSGAWSLVDYKTDDIGPEGVENHAAGNKTQLIVYAEAAEGFLKSTLKSSCFVFLTPGTIWYMEHRPDPDSLGPIFEGIRRGRFEPADPCADGCVYRPACPHMRSAQCPVRPA